MGSSKGKGVCVSQADIEIEFDFEAIENKDPRHDSFDVERTVTGAKINGYDVDSEKTLPLLSSIFRKEIQDIEIGKE